MKIIGHRGAMGLKPENTLSSTEKALEIGVDMIEIDVYALPSSELVVIHDGKVDRTTNGKGYVMDHSFKELRKLDAGDGQQIPTLEEVLEVINGKVPINIELKGAGTADPVAKVIKKYYSEKGWKADQFLISSFNHPELQAFKKLMPEINIGGLIVGIPVDYAEFAEKLGAAAINVSDEFIDQKYVDDAHRRGLTMNVFTVNDADDMLRMQKLGVDGIFTNFPDRAHQVLNS